MVVVLGRRMCTGVCVAGGLIGMRWCTHWHSAQGAEGDAAMLLCSSSEPERHLLLSATSMNVLWGLTSSRTRAATGGTARDLPCQSLQ